MDKLVFSQLIDDIKSELSTSPNSRFAIIGRTPVALDLLSIFASWQLLDRVTGIFDAGNSSGGQFDKSIEELARSSHTAVVIASDERKEALIVTALPYLRKEDVVLISGYRHFEFESDIFSKVTKNPIIQSLANGYPNTLIHIFQCLENAARLKLKGVVAEFGMFKGGTTLIISNIIRELGCNWKVVGFDSFDGFPPRQSALDMYRHPGCVFTDEDSVRKVFSDRNVEIVSGNITSTAKRLNKEDILLAFIDTDNFTPASAILDVIQDRVIVGGAIIFDHFTGRDRFRYTIGERFAAKRLLGDKRFFNLHDTGVFLRQRSD
jgi:O-methyltransferase